MCTPCLPTRISATSLPASTKWPRPCCDRRLGTAGRHRGARVRRGRQAHLLAIQRVSTIFWPLPARPLLVAVAGRSADRVERAAQRYGAQAAYPDWRRLIDDRRVQVLINAGPNDVHAEASVAGAARGLHVLCEKPLARTSREAAQMRDAAVTARIVHMTGYNYRFVPAVRLARQLIREGRLGRIYHFRTRYCDDSMVDPSIPYGWRHDQGRAASGGTRDLGRPPLDLARFLGGPASAGSATARIRIDRRPRRDGGRGGGDAAAALVAVPSCPPR